ncbi:MAG: IS110 family transposase [Pseudotabrizicola sp.]|uniref:IS110 family transposase n=1 Tax=Pseudotabrizicola sp. TaxID=2939647 RepID=UPI00272EF474|nr:IS110 family transposase [Pseudotabrizicola sp.]MDP2082839.1 IS110 family transposase [Pseudotabrizicola sp.]MDZ7574372.1 IS110 family transposase [Pseudotabrizicola sp.]
MRTKPIPETVAFGIDIGKKVFHVVALNAAGAIIQRAKFSRDTLIGFFEIAPSAVVGMEACPGSQWLARRLAAMGHDARIIPARFVKPYVKSNKTDTVDAAAIAEAVTRPTMRFVEVRTPEQVDLQALHRIRDQLVGQRTALMNQARAFCLEYGLAMRVGAGGFHADIQKHLVNKENDLTSSMRVLLGELLDDLGYIEGRIKVVNGKVEAYARENDTVSRLVTIPGIGALGATALVAAAGDGQQFRKARDLAAWLGLVPAEHSTGGKQTLLGISKRGNRYVRRLIIHGARSCLLHLNRANHALGGWLSALEARTHRNKAVVALANKLTRIVWAILTRPGTVYLQSKGTATS